MKLDSKDIRSETVVENIVLAQINSESEFCIFSATLRTGNLLRTLFGSVRTTEKVLLSEAIVVQLLM